LKFNATSQWNLDATQQTQAQSATASSSETAESYLVPPPSGYSDPDGKPRGTQKFNEVFMLASNPGGNLTTSLIDPAATATMTITSSADFKTLVVFNPEDRPVLAIEPWTLTSNGINVAARGVPDSGLLTLAPNEKWHGEITIVLNPSSQNS
jgi:galactose mutarotase-like enzyme